MLMVISSWHSQVDDTPVEDLDVAGVRSLLLGESGCVCGKLRSLCNSHALLHASWSLFLGTSFLTLHAFLLHMLQNGASICELTHVSCNGYRSKVDLTLKRLAPQDNEFPEYKVCACVFSLFVPLCACVRVCVATPCDSCATCFIA